MSANTRTTRTGPGAATGALVGILATAPLTAVSYLGWKVAGLPFIAFDVFEWASRLVPGAVVTRGIEAMVAAIRLLSLGRTDVAGKYAEQVMAVAGLLLAGAAAGSVLFALSGGRAGTGGRAGMIVGAAAGVLSALISRNLDNATGVPAVLWIVALWMVWGAVLDRTYRRLGREAAVATRGPRVQAPEIIASGRALDSVERIDRRRFLIRLGGAAAAITVSGAVVGILAGPRRIRPTASAAKRWSEDHALPNAGAAVRPAPGTRPEFTPLDDHYRIDITLLPPVIREEDWTLKIGGLVDRPTGLTLADLRDNFRPMHQFVTLACISNEVAGDLTSTTRWTG